MTPKELNLHSRAIECNTPISAKLSRSEVGWIAVPTCNRVKTLERCLASYIENNIEHSRSTQFIIADDSEQADVRNTCRELLRRLSRKYQRHFWYSGLEEKLIFAKKLMQTSGAPPQLVKFALFDSSRLGLPTYGANR